MASINAKAVAQEVMEKVRNGKKINMQNIQKNHGYSPKSAKSMKAKRTKTYKKEMRPIVEQLEAERQAVIKCLPKARGEAKYRDLVNAIDKLTRNIQLMGGGATERIDWLTELHDEAEKEEESQSS